MVNRYRPMRLILTTTRMLSIADPLSFEGEPRAARQGRQLQIDKKYVANGGFFEL